MHTAHKWLCWQLEDVEGFEMQRSNSLTVICIYLRTSVLDCWCSNRQPGTLKHEFLLTFSMGKHFFEKTVWVFFRNKFKFKFKIDENMNYPIFSVRASFPLHRMNMIWRCPECKRNIEHFQSKEWAYGTNQTKFIDNFEYFHYNFHCFLYQMCLCVMFLYAFRLNCKL